MKYSPIFIVTLVSVWVFILFPQNVQAQQNLAQEAYAIFEQSCLICHGENGSFRESLIIEHTALIDDGKVIPGDPDGSVFYQRLIETDIAKRMPLGQPPLAPEAIKTIYQWIAAGAPDWNAIPSPEIDFITTDAMLATIENHVNSLSARDKSFARYFTLTHLYNAGETTEALNAYRRALSKLVNSLSWGREVVKPQPIDAEQTIYYIDLRDYEWDVRNDAWTQIEQAYPYKMTFDAPTQTHLREKLTTLQQEMSCEVPFVHVDWFLANASLPPLYHDILALPDTDRELEAALEVYVAENIQNAPGKRVWRAGFNDSGVSRHNRIVERHISRYGAYWKSYDFAGSAESQNIFTHPLDFTHDGGEIIFNLPNGLQAYYLVDGDGIRLDVAPTDIVSNPAVSDPAVRNGLSCIGCHTEGMKTFEDEVRAVVEKADNPPFNKERALDLYVEKSVMNLLVEEDTQRYKAALEAAGGIFGGIEPVQRFHEAFQGPLSAAHAAAAVGLETDVFLGKISKNVSLQNLLGVLVIEGGTVKRDAWTSNFHDVIAGINSPDTVLPPVVERPEIIPGAGVHIPDVNLRAAIEEALGKENSDSVPITFEEMATLTQLRASNKDIHDLTGLEQAVNLEEMWIDNNPVSDISPLAQLPNFIGLHAWKTSISDLSPLTGLTKLRWLNFGRTPITSLEPLAALTNLKKLTFYAGGVKEISALAGLTELTELNFGRNFISDLSPLAALINLEHLGFHGNDIASLSPLAGLNKLRHLDLRSNLVSDVSDLARLTSLTNLSLVDNKISDVSPLAGLINLEELTLNANQISDISSLAGLINLKVLALRENLIIDISPLEGFSKHTYITLIGNPGVPKGGPKIEGPWLWMLIPGNQLDSITDLLAEASNGLVTEHQIASKGATEGKSVGNIQWTAHKIPSTEVNNVIEVLRDFGISHDENIDNSVLYGFVALYSPREQKTTMFVGTDGNHKIWLNGELIHNDLGFPRSLYPDYDLFFPVTLRQGANMLLVAIDGGHFFNGFFGFEEGTEYTVLNTSDIPIPDPNLRAAIAEALGKEDDTVPITLEEMATLTTLRASNRDIKDLTGIEYAINLEELWISENPVSDLSPLSGLKNFIGLHAWDTDITDLSPLAEMSKLRWLDFGRTPISDLSPLADISSLRKLTVYAGSNLNDISPLAELTGLTFLSLGSNRISDISPVAGLINLESLIVYHGAALTSDLSVLAGLTKLKHLNLRTKKTISDLSPLSGLTELTSLILFGNIISDLSPLSTLINLEELDLSENLISDISPLAVLTNLRSLNLAKNSISDISPLLDLLELGNIKSLNLNDNLITDTSPLEKWFSPDTYIKFLRNPGVPKDGPNILGPWLWMLVRDRHLDSTTDLLAEASNGLVTEDQIAVNGATPGTFVGDIQWTTHNISTTGKQNLLEVLRDLGQSNYSNYDEIHNNVLYGSMVLYSPREQQTTIFVGTDGHHKIWLNGEYVHNDLGFQRSYFLDYDMFFSVTLKQGVNMLLVAIDGGYWFNGFFGFEEGTEYTVIPPDVRYTFSATETTLLAGDTLTLNLNAENITDLAGWQTDITFDPNILEAVEVTEGDFLKSEGENTFFQGGTIDNTVGKITDLFSARIAESGVSGTGTLLSVTFKAKAGGETQVTLENFEFSSITGDIILAVPPNITITVGEYPPWDVNQDGRVSIHDLVLVASDLGADSPTNLRTDVNRDGVVDDQDLILVQQHMGESTDPTEQTDPAAPPILAIDTQELTSTMVQAWIAQAQAANDGSLAFRQGIENLQKLLASLLPEKTALLPNFPNPFNPETWIPYHLAKPAEVTLTIYAANGAIVRTLALGHQAAGIYQSRGRAAHWDGRNSVGESVASGIYFYTLSAGDFTATRKMLILK